LEDENPLAAFLIARGFLPDGVLIFYPSLSLLPALILGGLVLAGMILSLSLTSASDQETSSLLQP
jgi:hypothetical protein